MAFRLVSKGWGTELENALRRDHSDLRIVSPFIKRRAVQRLLALRPERVRVITRFNLNDFGNGVSDIDALRRLLDCGAAVRGIRSLHAKLYVFGNSAAVVTSANLSTAGLDTNPEFGLVTEDPAAIRSCLCYFDGLWSLGNDDLRFDQLDQWAAELTLHLASGAGRGGSRFLSDRGVDAGLPEPSRVAVPSILSEADQAFVKFHGRGDDRVPLSQCTLRELKDAGCHWAVAYPLGKQPQIVKEGAVMFIARLTENPNDIRVFGHAIAMKRVPGRDDATPSDIARRPWKAEWPHYVRVHNAEFVDGTLENGVSLAALMDALGTDSFVTTQQRAAKGEANVNPRLSVRRQPAVRLSQQGREWLNERLQVAFDTHGKIPRSTLGDLDWPEIA